jgi:hypothetical protein
MTEAGKHNLKNISEEFGCTIISCKPNIKAQKTLMRTFLKNTASPPGMWTGSSILSRCIMAAKFNTPFLCYGENVSFEYGGNADLETYSAKTRSRTALPSGSPRRSCWATA